MRLLITGGAGFIGSHLAEHLLDAGHEVTAIDNLSLGRERNIAHLAGHPRFRFERVEILDAPALDAAFAAGQFEVVFHLAANSDIARSHAEPDVDRDDTFGTTYAVLKAMKSRAVRQIVFASTSAIYGELGGALREDSGPLQPVSHYGAGKLASEAFVASFAANYGNRSWILRFPNVVGGRSTHGAVHDFIGKLRRNPAELEVLGDGRQNKPYLYVKDLVEAIAMVWQKTSDAVNVFNIGVESRTTVSRIAAIVIEEMGLDASLRYTGGAHGWVGDVPEFHYALDKIHALGSRTRVSSDDAIRLAVRAILEDDHEGGHHCRRQGNAAGAHGCAQANGPRGGKTAA